MDRLENEDIGMIWVRHYPKRVESASSMSLCVTLAMIIKQRAKSVHQYNAWSDKLRHVLSAARVPKEQFDTLESESNAEIQKLSAEETERKTNRDN
jgi:septal ring factor EnvC (AmiA/AmiB activator)